MNDTNGHGTNPIDIFSPHRLFDESNPRWRGITRDHSEDDVKKLSGSVQLRYTLAEIGS